MNYFEFYGLDQRFDLDEASLKKLYISKSMKLHPDQNDVDIELSSFNNEAYTTLKDEKARMKYILQLNNISLEGNAQILSPDFLMEMIELNEKIDEALSQNDQTNLSNISNELEELEHEYRKHYIPILEKYSSELNDEAKHLTLNAAKDYYLILQYLRRLKMNLQGQSEV